MNGEERKSKLPPHLIRKHLSKDVHAILSVCITDFDEDMHAERETCFNVDAVTTGKNERGRVRFEQTVIPAEYARARLPENPLALRKAERGDFIPHAQLRQIRARLSY
jgi:hypothetical protein